MEVGLPPCISDSEAVFDGDPLALPLKAYLVDKMQTTIGEAAEGMGIDVIDWATRYRIGKLLALWGWQQKSQRVAYKRTTRTARVFHRPQPLLADMTDDAL